MKKSVRIFTGLLAAAVAVTGLPIPAAAEISTIEWGVKPEDGTTEEQPFLSGTGGSTNFRIPGIVTLNDGTIVAACDARWNHGGDACGLDTIVSRSTDNGATWNYTFANYLGDYGNKKHEYSTAFIDPAVTTDGENVYMIADVWPGSYAINTAPNRPMTGYEFDKDGNLLLSGDNRKSFAYHLEKNENEDEESYYVIKDNNSGAVVEGYTIDAYFNIKDSTGATNLFCYNSPYLVYPTDYLYLTKSADGGATWSVPKLLNVKKPTEKSLLVGPGRGITTSTGRIIFTAYEFTDGDRNSACIYSDDKGETWHRGQSVPQTSSEAAIVEADGRLYIFTRHGGYNVSEDWGETWSEKKDPGISYCLSCELSAITYSKKIDGKTAIIFSAPSATGRSAGKLFVGLVEKDGTISWDYDYSVNGEAYYAYSCLTELKDGSIGLLYENGGASITYTNIPISDVAPGAAISNIWCKNKDGEYVTNINLKSESSVELNVFGGKESAEITASADNEGLLNVSLEDGILTITSGKVTTGMSRGIVTLTDGANEEKLVVNVGAAQEFQALDLRIGDTYTISAENPDEIWVQDDRIVRITKNGNSLTVEGLAEGSTEIEVDSVTYYVIVKNDEKDLDVRRGQKVVVKGSVIQKEADASIVSVTKNETKAPYEKADEIKTGEAYLIGNTASIVMSNDSEEKSPLGRAMKTVNYKSNDLSEFMWTLSETDGGYTIQSKDGGYLYFANPDGGSCDITISDTEQVLDISEINDGFSVGCTLEGVSYYMNNYANANVRAAGYSSNNNTWYFYQPAASYMIQGLKEGKTSIAVDGTTYNITVGACETEDEVREALKSVKGEADILLQESDLDTVYTAESVKALRDACQAVQNILESQEEYQVDALKQALSALEKAMQLEKKAPVINDPNQGGQNTGGNKDDNTQQDPQPPAPVELPKLNSVHSYQNADYIVTSATAAGGTVTYKQPAKKKTVQKVKIPNTIEINGLTYKVTEIAQGALKGCKKLQQVTIGTNVTKIGKSAFEKSAKLKKITINSKVLNSIGKNALKGINKTCAIKVPKKQKAKYNKLLKKAGLKSSMKVK